MCLPWGKVEGCDRIAHREHLCGPYLAKDTLAVAGRKLGLLRKEVWQPTRAAGLRNKYLVEKLC